MTFGKENTELNLMNAHLAIENSHAGAALEFLAKVTVGELKPGLAAVYYRTLGQATILQKNYAEGIALLEKALAKFEEDPATIPLQTARVRNWIGLACYEQGNISRALDVHYRCLKEVFEKSIEDCRFRLKIYLNLGNDYLLLGQTELAQSFFRQALEERSDDEDREDLAAIHWGFGLTYRNQKNTASAYEHFSISAAFYQELNQPAQFARVQTQLSLVLIDLKDYNSAVEVLQTAYAQATACTPPDLTTLLSATTNLALLHLRMENLTEAEEWGAAGLAHRESLARYDPLLLAQAQAQQAEIKLALEKSAEAVALFEQAVASIEQTGVVAITRQILYRYYAALKKLGHLQKAFEILNRAYLITHSPVDPFSLQPR